MSAEFVDALKGYEFFLKNRGLATLHEINNYLYSQRRRPIQQRTYSHYKKLIAHGFRSYIPINKFDVFQSLGKIELAADRRRYYREEIEVPVLISREGTIWINGKILDKSLVGFGIVTEQKFPVKTGTQILVRLEGYNDIQSIVVWREHLKDVTKLGVRSIEFIAKYRSTRMPEENRLKGMFVIARETGGAISWGQLFRILEKTDEILNAADDLIYALGDALNKEINIAKPVLQSIKFSSPGETQIKIDFGIAEIIKIIFEDLQFLGLEKQKRKAEVRKLELENQKQDLENKNFSLEILRNAFNLKREIDDEPFTDGVINNLSKSLLKTMGITKFPPGIFDKESLERGILRQRIIPPAAELIGGDDPDFTVNATTDEPEDQRLI